MKKLLTAMSVLCSVSTAFAAPLIELSAFAYGKKVLATINIHQSNHDFYTEDLYYLVTGEKQRISVHSKIKNHYHPYFNKLYITSKSDSSLIGKIEKAEAMLVVKSCLTEDFTDCSIVEQKHFDLEFNDSDILSMTPNEIHVTI